MPLNTNSRRQLTLFVDPEQANEIEQVRQRFNPIQQALIDSHVTLCREDELIEWEVVSSNLQQLVAPGITIHFGPVTRFEQGLGVMLPAKGDNEEYHSLRAKVLAGIPGPFRRPEPHITLMHPRNSSCTNELFTAIQEFRFPVSLVFKEISLIEQVNGGKWHVLERYPLKGGAL